MVSVSLGFNYEDAAAFNLTTLAHNAPIALAIAVASFPEQALIALALVIGPLIELPVITVISQLLLRIQKRNVQAYSKVLYLAKQKRQHQDLHPIRLYQNKTQWLYPFIV